MTGRPKGFAASGASVTQELSLLALLMVSGDLAAQDDGPRVDPVPVTMAAGLILNLLLYFLFIPLRLVVGLVWRGVGKS